MVLAWLLLVAGLSVAETATGNDPVADAAPTLPAGFTRAVYNTNLFQYQLAGLTFIPGQDRMFLTGKCGSLRRLDVDGALLVMPSIPGVNCQTDRGLLGLAPAPDFASSGRVYTLYNFNGAKPDGTPAVMARLSRWTVDDPADPTALLNEVVLINDLPAYSTTGATCDDSHTVGTVIAAPNGDLYVGNGDASSYCQADDSSFGAQDLNSPRGKVFRIDGDTGQGLPGNPYYDGANPASWRSRTFAYGLRNPFRITLKPGTSTLYIGDVGWNSYEEIDVAKGGENFGWPCFEGPRSFRNGYANKSSCVGQYASPPANLTDPLWAWSHAGSGSASVAGSFYPSDGSGNYPASYRGAFFFGDYAKGKIWTLQTDADDHLVRAPEAAGFASEIGAPVGFGTGPSGDIYYADIATSQVVRLRYADGNRAPVAVATADKTAGQAPLTVNFDGDDSYDLDNEPITYAWDFGDGTTSTAANPTKTYNARGSYVARLTVTDSLGASSSATVSITSENSPPVLLVSVPPAGTKFGVGDDVQLPALGVDAEDGLLPASAITYEQRIRHCPFGDCHQHPSETTVGEENTPFTCEIPDHGDDAFLQVIISVTDNDGLSTSRTVELETDAHDLSVSSSPAGVPITVNQTDSNTHPVVKAIRGSQNRVVAPTSHGERVFASWSDGGAADHSFIMGDEDRDLVATYTTPPVAEASASPDSGPAPLETTLSAAGSSDPDGDALTYRWTFGDGGSATDETVAHTYTTDGTYTATVTVTDANGVARSASTTVEVGGQPQCLGEPATIVGTEGDDDLVGTSDRDVIVAGAGVDLIAGLAGDDLVCGGAGEDTIDYSGAPAAVTVDLSGASPSATGGHGDDQLDSIESVIGSPHADHLEGSDGANRLDGGAGDDTFVGRRAADTIIGGAGSDTVDYASAPSFVAVFLNAAEPFAVGGDGDDQLSSIENVAGSRYDDWLVGGTATNVLEGGDGNDLIEGVGYGDQLDGGSGVDTVSYGSATAPVQVQLSLLAARMSGAPAADVVRGFENVTGSRYGDTLVGDDGINTINGGSGDDRLAGRLAADTLIGGAGADTVDYADAPSYVAVFLNVATPFATGGDGDDRLSSIENVAGSPYNDWMIGSQVINLLQGKGGDDRIQGIGEADRLDGGAGTDTVSYADATASVRVRIPILSARLATAATSDVVRAFENIVGSRYNDYLEGGDGVSVLDGGPGNDSIDGRGANDTIFGAAGTDRADGGQGTDTCRTAETRLSCER